METTIQGLGLGLFRDNEKENRKYCLGFRVAVELISLLALDRGKCPKSSLHPEHPRAQKMEARATA